MVSSGTDLSGGHRTLRCTTVHAINISWMHDYAAQNADLPFDLNKLFSLNRETQSTYYNAPIGVEPANSFFEQQANSTVFDSVHVNGTEDFIPNHRLDDMPTTSEELDVEDLLPGIGIINEATNKGSTSHVEKVPTPKSSADGRMYVKYMIFRNANQYASKDAYYLIGCGAHAPLKNETLNVTKMLFVGFDAYDNPSGVGNGLAAMKPT